MTQTELFELIACGENAQVEFMRDATPLKNFPKKIVSLLNISEEGIILLGVERDGSISGLRRSHQEIEEWILNISKENIRPFFKHTFESVRIDSNRLVGIIRLPKSNRFTPYRVRKNDFWVTYVRAGSTSRQASRTDDARLYESRLVVRPDTRPVQDVGLDNLDFRRIESYFRVVMNKSTPEIGDVDQWQEILLESDLLAEADDNTICASAIGSLLFEKKSIRGRDQAGVTIRIFPEAENHGTAIQEKRISGPLTPLLADDRSVISGGMIDQSIDFVTQNMGSVTGPEAGVQNKKQAYPLEAVREAIVNAVAYRDYTENCTDIVISLYHNRLEITSPGGLHDSETIDKVK